MTPLKLPPLVETRLSNGLAIVVAERHGLPLVAARLVVFAGSARDPVGKGGLASLTGEVLRRGTATRTAIELDDAIERVGGGLYADVGRDSSELATSLPSAHLDAALDVLADLAMHPAFPPAEVDLARRRTLASLARDLDDPAAVADRFIAREGFGEASPYGHPIHGRQKTVASLTRDDLVLFHRAAYTPANAVLFVVGDVSADEARALAEKRFGAWTGAAPAPLAITPPVAGPARVVLVDKPDASQAQIRFVAPGLTEASPDWPAAYAANACLGGGFTAILMDEIRVKRGLTYGASSRFNDERSAGLFVFSSFTKNASIHELASLARDLIAGFRATGPTAEQLEKAKAYVTGLYPLGLETNDQLCAALASAAVKGLPFASIADFPAKLAAVTPEQAKAAAAKYLPADAATLVVVGEAKAAEAQLQGFGPIAKLPLSAAE